MDQKQFGGSLGGPVRKNRTFYFANVERRILDQSGLVTIDPAARAPSSTRGSRRPAIRARRSRPASIRNPVRSTNVLGKVDHQASGPDQFSLRYALYDVSSLNSRGAGGLSAPTASAGLDNIDQTDRAQQHLDVLAEDGQRNARADHARRSAGAADRSDRPGRRASRASRRSARCRAARRRRVNTLYEVVDNLSHQAGAHALRAGVDVLYNDDTITFPRSIRGAYTFSSLANFLAGVYNNAGFTQTFGATDRVADQPERRALRTGRMEGRTAASR